MAADSGPTTPVSFESAPGWTENRPSHVTRLNVPELWRAREIGYFLALRDLQLRYKQTLIGVAWVVIQPLATTAMFAVVFGRLVDVPSDGLPYPVFVLAAMVAWTYVSSAVTGAAGSLVEHREMVTKIYFPRLLAPIAAILPGILDFGIELLLVCGAIALYGIAVGASIALLPLWIVAAVVVALAVGVWFAALNVQYRDVRYALPFVTQLWFISSPIVFPSSLFEGVERYLLAINPMVGVIDGLRWSLLGAPPPPAADLVSLATTGLLLASGIVYFRRTERRFADVI